MSEDEDKSEKNLKARMKLAKTATMNQLDLAKMGLMKMTSKGNLYEPSTKGEVTLEGYLFKKSPGGIPLMRHWHKRWFVLESPGKLLYYTDKDKQELKGIIPLDMIEKMLSRSTRLTLLMEGASENAPPRKFSLKGDSEAIVKTWSEAINKAFVEIDRLEDQEEQEHKMVDLGEGDAKYWKVETRKKLNLSVALGDKPAKKGGLKINPRAKEIEAKIHQSDTVAQVAEQAVRDQKANEGYMSLDDDLAALSSSTSSSLSEHEEAECTHQRVHDQEETELAATIATSRMDQAVQHSVLAEG